MRAVLTKKDIHWGYLWFFVIVHAVGFYGIWYAVVYAHMNIVIAAVVYFFLAHLSITCGAHRLYAHESYRASTFLQYVLVLLFSATFQGPILWWAGKHKHHHATEDDVGDPHSPHVDGFWYSHMGWMLSKRGLEPAPGKYLRTFARKDGSRYRFAPALWQGEHYFPLATLMTFVVPTIVGSMLGDWWGGLLVIGFGRLLLQYHFTWVVNSVGHLWGEHLTGKSTNVWALAVPTVGESFHANHHASPGDYRLGRTWWQIDLGRYTIELLALMGLAWDLRIPTNAPVVKT